MDFDPTLPNRGLLRPVRVLPRGFSAAVIDMSTVLTPNEKRVFRRILELDRPTEYREGGCFASVASHAKRLAMNPDGFTKVRRELERLGLLVRSRFKGSAERWFPAMPPGFNLERPCGIRNGRATDAWLEQLAATLDEFLEAQRPRRKGPNQRAKSSVKLDEIAYTVGRSRRGARKIRRAQHLVRGFETGAEPLATTELSKDYQDGRALLGDNNREDHSGPHDERSSSPGTGAVPAAPCGRAGREAGIAVSTEEKSEIEVDSDPPDWRKMLEGLPRHLPRSAWQRSA
jgi:hypothetical protein